MLAESEDQDIVSVVQTNMLGVMLGCKEVRASSWDWHLVPGGVCRFQHAGGGAGLQGGACTCRAMGSVHGWVGGFNNMLGTWRWVGLQGGDTVFACGGAGGGWRPQVLTLGCYKRWAA